MRKFKSRLPELLAFDFRRLEDLTCQNPDGDTPVSQLREQLSISSQTTVKSLLTRQWLPTGFYHSYRRYRIPSAWSANFNDFAFKGIGGVLAFHIRHILIAKKIHGPIVCIFIAHHCDVAAD
jgi:hypothetical protein